MAKAQRSSRSLSREADRQIADLHAAIRCRCCPEGLFTRHIAGAASAETAPSFTREDFLGLLDRADIDPGMDGAG